MKSLRNLNGWRRIWVVIVVIAFLCCLSMAIDIVPKKSEYSNDRTRDSINILGIYLESTNPGYNFEGPYLFKDKYYKRMSDDEIISEIHTKYNGKINFTPIEDEYNNNISHIWSEGVKAVLHLFAGWIVFSASLYIAGFLVAWIIQGFRSKSKPMGA